jgi:hypothetical protein
MFLGIKGAENPAPAAFCTVKEGHGDYMNQKWLSCNNDFDCSYSAVDISGHHLVTYQTPLLQSTVIPLTTPQLLQNSKCVGSRIKNDQTSDDLLQATGESSGLVKLPAGDGTPGTQ